MSRRLEDLHPYLKERFLDLQEAFEEDNPGYTLKVVQTYRSPVEQIKLFAKGRTKPGRIVTYIDGVNKMGHHNHYPSRAFDVGVFKGGQYVTDVKHYQFGEYAKMFGMEWGGNWKRFKDRPHFQLPKNLEDSMIFGRKWLIRKALQYVGSGERISEFVNAKVDIPGISEEVEGELMRQITTGTMSMIVQALDGEKVELPFSKRYLARRALLFVADNASSFMAEIDIPFVSEETESEIGDLLASAIKNDVLPLVDETL